MKKTLFFVFSLITLSLNAQYGDQTVVTIAGQNGLLHLPATYSSTTRNYPLIIQLPGAGSHTIDDVKNKFIAKYFYNNSWGGDAVDPRTGISDSFIVFSSAEALFTAPSGITTAEAVLNGLISNYRVDKNSINLTGFSRGGQFTLWYPAHITNGGFFTPQQKIATSVIFSGEGGVVPVDSLVKDTVYCWGFGDPIADIHGENTIKNMDSINARRPGLARSTIHALGHKVGNFYSPTYKENVDGYQMNVYQWMICHKRNSLTMGQIAGSPFHVTATTGATVNVSFTSTGVIGAGNVYKVKLSDASGNFSAGVQIGSLTSNANSGTIVCTIPAGTPSGTNYKIRIRSTNPVLLATSKKFEIILSSSLTLTVHSGNGVINCKYTIPQNGTVSLTLLDNSGRPRANLNSKQNAGSYSRIFDQQLTPGIYTVVLLLNQQKIASQRILIAK